MLTLADLDAARAAQQVQQHAPDWFVIWSLRHRRFEAWQCTDPQECRIVYAQSAIALWNLMQQTEVDLWRTSPYGATPPPGAASLEPPLPVTPGLVPHPRALLPAHTEQAPRPRPSSWKRRRP
ncbi:hypothetical protein [Streptosporangium amethystogenes]|uniref:hypothetical protein n=1 Tax=Streptosporangium amethystogenes TaxID=2002 RepID=UPI0004C7E7F6|nr:hypothetical protein [Streptosporangium amethystogenes]